MTNDTACDTSVLIPALLTWHPAHEACRALLRDDLTHVPAHVLIEAFSVMTRLPSPHRVNGDDAAAVLGALTLKPVTLTGSSHVRLLGLMAARHLRGGAIYDGLVGLTATHHRLRLLTRDRRAMTTYDAVGATYTVV